MELNHIQTHRDMETKINQIDKFLNKDYKVKISLRLSGREKTALRNSS